MYIAESIDSGSDLNLVDEIGCGVILLGEMG